MSHQRNEYENYILISDSCKCMAGNYQGYLRFKELMFTLSSMVSKNSNTFTYQGEMYVSRLTNNEITKIQNSLNFGTYSSELQKLKYMCSDLGIAKF